MSTIKQIIAKNVLFGLRLLANGGGGKVPLLLSKSECDCKNRIRHLLVDADNCKQALC